MTKDFAVALEQLNSRVTPTLSKEVPPLYLPWTQRVLNPFPLASSGGAWGDQAQPWAVNVLAFYASVFVNSPNNGTNFWTLRLTDTTGTALATLTTAALTAGVWSRLTTTLGTQPGASNTVLSLTVTATLSPGSIYIAPFVALLRTGN